MDTRELERSALDVRRRTLELIAGAGRGHIGGALSCTDILAALYMGRVLRVDPARPAWELRDRFILSKGHSCVALYCVLAEMGFFPAADLARYGTDGTIFSGHPERHLPGVEVDTGSLGHGIGVGAGLALGARLSGQDWFSFVLMGDGECQEGSVWESAMFAAHHRLDTLVAIIDYNGIGATDFLKDSVDVAPLEEKWKAFGWETTVVDGHAFAQLVPVLQAARSRGPRPHAVICRTVKGRGVSAMEGSSAWHHKIPKGDVLAQARRDLAPR